MAKKVITLDNIVKLIGTLVNKEQVLLKRQVCSGLRNGEYVYLVCDAGISESVSVVSIGTCDNLVAVVPSEDKEVHTLLTGSSLHDFESEHPFMYVSDVVNGKLMYDGVVVGESELDGFTYKID